MTKTDTASLLAMFQIYWPNFQIIDACEGIPGTVDAWHDLVALEQPSDCASALKSLARQPDRKFAPTIGEFLGAVRECRISRIQHDQAQSRLALPAPAVASPERLAEFWKELGGILSKVPSVSVYSRKSSERTPDETHDWQKTFTDMDCAKGLALGVDNRPLKKQPDGKWR